MSWSVDWIIIMEGKGIWIRVYISIGIANIMQVVS